MVKFLKFLVYLISLAATVVYIGYRLAFTMPFNLYAIDIIFGLIVIFVELIEALEFGVYFWHVLRPRFARKDARSLLKDEIPEQEESPYLSLR